MDIFASNSVISSLEVALKGLQRRFKASSANVANAETPFYVAKQVSFEDSLAEVQYKLKNHGENTLEVTHAGHIPLSAGSVLDTNIDTLDSADPFVTNNNNVSIDREMVTMAKTGMKFKAMTSLTKRFFDHINTVIKG
jgi:flagellar basal-body rod protein FlgB